VTPSASEHISIGGIKFGLAVPFLTGGGVWEPVRHWSAETGENTMSMTVSSKSSAMQEALESPAQTAQEASRGDLVAVRKLAAEQAKAAASAVTAGTASDPGPATVVSISSQAKTLATPPDEEAQTGETK
jgi:hypothetical protein